MVLNIVAAALVIGITLYHSLFGLFSGVINAFCAIIAAAITFGFVDVVNDLLTQQGLPPNYVLPATFVGLFIIAHGGLRYAADSFIRGNMRVPNYADWIGGGLCGFIVAQISVGMLVLGFMMLPMSNETLIYTGIQRAEENEQDQRGYVMFSTNSVWMNPDGFTVGLMNLLSTGSLKGETTLPHVYPDYAEWVRWTRNTVQDESMPAPFRDEDGNGFEDGLDVQNWWREPASVEAMYRDRLPEQRDDRENKFDETFSGPELYRPEAGQELIGTRLNLKTGSADRTKNKAAVHLFRPTMIRIVGDVRGEPRQAWARILANIDMKTAPVGDQPRVVDPDNNIEITSGTATIDAWFEVPEGFTPRFVEYRRYARDECTEQNELEAPPERIERAAAPAEDDEADDQPAQPRADRGEERRDNRGLDELTGRITPIPFDPDAPGVQSRGGELLPDTRITGFLDDLSDDGPDAVTGFVTPPGMKLVRFGIAGRGRGRGLMEGAQWASTQHQAVGSDGQQYGTVGFYGIASRAGGRYLELYYAGGPETPSGMSFRGTLEFTELNRVEITRTSDSILVVMFLMPEGVELREVVDQRGGTYPGLVILPHR